MLEPTFVVLVQACPLNAPAALARGLDDRAYALDHFEAKLFRVAEGFLTRRGQEMAVERTQTMRDFVRTMVAEVG